MRYVLLSVCYRLLVTQDIGVGTPYPHRGVTMSQKDAYHCKALLRNVNQRRVTPRAFSIGWEELEIPCYNIHTQQIKLLTTNISLDSIVQSCSLLNYFPTAINSNFIQNLSKNLLFQPEFSVNAFLFFLQQIFVFITKEHRMVFDFVFRFDDIS